MKTTAKIWAAILLIFSLSFAGTAAAADAVVPSDGTWLDLAQPVLQAFSGGHYAYCAALAVILMVALLKRYGLPGDVASQEWLHSDLGGSLLALVASTATACAAGLATPGAHITLALLKSALLVGVGAAGGFAALKNLVIEPLLKPAQAWLDKRVPLLAKPLALVMWIFDHGDVTPSDAPPTPQPAPQPAPSPAPAPVAPTGN